MRFRLKLALMIAAVGLGVVLSATTTAVLNPASDLLNKTLVTAEGNRTITGTWSFSVPLRLNPGTTNAPGVVSTTDQTTGWQLGAGSIGGSISATQDFLLNSSGLTLFSVSAFDGAGHLTTTGINGLACTLAVNGLTVSSAPALCTLVEQTAGAGITVTLPAASTCTTAKNRIGIKNETTNVITVARTGADTIDGAASFSTTGIQFESFDFVCNAAGNGWMVR